VRFNALKSSDLVKEISIVVKDDSGNELWVSHPDPAIDISVVHLNGRWLREQGLQSDFFENDHHCQQRWEKVPFPTE
jgi:hypothetical protein